ncbi:hypothetical protein FACS1894181_08630 [Bacteroidia bacterium]|nr:hypothetical protein FACS1894181_08630 [Bacteroidia bacterium]
METVHRLQSFLINNAKQVYNHYEGKSFHVFIHPKDPLMYFNYAIPSTSIFKDFEVEYSTIEKIFKENNRQIRFEFLEEAAPLLPHLLSSAGLKEEYRGDFMICTGDSHLIPAPVDDFLVSELNSSSTPTNLKEFKFIQEIVFNQNDGLHLSMIDEQDVISRIGKGLGFVGHMKDTPVSACQYTEIIDGITELAGIATLPDYRCRGLGGKITSIAAGTAYRNGANLVCLSAADANASHVYSNAGFKKFATMLAYS